ncbi:methylmalonyl-CoA mutase family protein [Nocardioides jiangxiensis]|uniref:Methylmalonyl-CoA mutase family protein n=1 Tax=Nocardioides jiangxiensis TaxID=3064524 RepID=A0ABT9AY96_9ACTN|nr:methylmalonyl-CoA mutase family protein [Nocardioides sp. WY-20]MDO7867546.1 methylmalonyl-CoA mutase family protein [Nocardioides sp. WY-20]
MTGPIEDRLALASEQDQHSAADWEKITAAVLRKSGRLTDEDADAAVWTKLARTTLDGISVAPIGTPADLEGLVTAGRPTREGAWDIRSLVADPEAKAANEAALADLNGGVTSLWIAADDSTDLAATLAGVDLAIAPIVLDAPTATLRAAQAFAALAEGQDLHADTNLGADPLGAFARGLADASDPAPAVAVAEIARGLGVRGIVVDATVAHDLGASDAQELGYGLGVGVAYLRALTAAGFSVEEAAGQIEFRLAATDEQFPTIAKFRAARRLWARVLELSGAAEEARTMRIHGVTSRPMFSKYDPYVNMLRGTVAAFAAGVGGAEAVTVLPFDSANGRPDAFGRRIARNTSHLLIDESHVAKVADPAGGSYAVEKLTDALAVAGWEELGRFETDGLAGLSERVAIVIEKREQQIATRRRPLTGVSEFPNLTEELPQRAADPLNERVRRYGASFEALRDEPATSPVFLATLGPVAQHTARATFISNLFAAGGIAVEAAGATASADDLVKAYQGQKVVALAGTDKAYAEWGAAAIEALRGAGAAYVILAGKPGDLAVDDSAAMGLDALAFLNRTREALA